MVRTDDAQSGDSGSILLSNAVWGRWPTLWRLAKPGLDGKNVCGGKLLRTDRPVLTRLGVGPKIAQQRRDLDAEPDPKATTTKTQRIMRRVDFRYCG